MPAVVVHHITPAGISLWCLWDGRIFVVLGVRLGLFAPEAESPVREVERAKEDDGGKELDKESSVSKMLTSL